MRVNDCADETCLVPCFQCKDPDTKAYLSSLETLESSLRALKTAAVHRRSNPELPPLNRGPATSMAVLVARVDEGMPS